MHDTSGTSGGRGPVLLGLAAGLVTGGLTSLLQTVAAFPWLALVNAVSPWITVAFVAGALQRGRVAAAWVGPGATTLAVLGYYGTAALRGFDVSTTYLVIWSVSALVGGPVFGLAGQVWRQARPPGVGAALLVAAWGSEAVVVYAARLGYTSSAVLFGVVAALLALGLGTYRGQVGALARWLVPAGLAGVLGHLVLGVVTG